MNEKIVTLDIETENTGYDIMEDNKRIISIQLMEGTKTKIFYDGSKTDRIEAGENKLHSLIESGKNFVGFNIRNFDVRLIKKFLGIEIPASQIIEISEMPKMNNIRKHLRNDWPRLVDCCEFMDVECSHKGLIDEQSNRLKKRPDVIKKAKEGAVALQERRGWSFNYAYNQALDKISGGTAILEAFNEFVGSKGDPNTIFYRYAMGDVFSENALYLKMK